MRLNQENLYLPVRSGSFAVTEVNGCEACSYAHTKFALEEGQSRGKLAILSGGQSIRKMNGCVFLPNITRIIPRFQKNPGKGLLMNTAKKVLRFWP